jgi:hypothetical protein
MATATFIGTDTTTEGSWIGVYGADGYRFPSTLTLVSSPPSYVTGWDESGPSQFQWGSGSDIRRLQNPANPTGARYAETWYSGGTLDLLFNVGSTTRRVAIYCLDDDGSGRVETLFIQDSGTGTTLDSQGVSNFQSGKWLVWDVTGNLRLRVTYSSGVNSVVAALMWDTPGTPPVTGPDVAYWG